MSDIVIVGGGVIGLSIASEIARRGLSVTVIDQASVGHEASWAGAGILPPGNLSQAVTPEARLRAYSHSLWIDWSQRLQSETGIDNGFRTCGGIDVSLESSLDADVRTWQDEGVRVEPLSGEALQHHEPAVSSRVQSCFRLPDLCQVRNPRHLKAVRAQCLNLGVTLMEGATVTGWRRQGEQVLAVSSTAGDVAGEQFVLTAGAWSRVLLQQAGADFPIEPIRGQIALLSVPRPMFHHVVQAGSRYLVPRPDGRILVGATEERTGFVKRNTVDGIQGLLKFAADIVPSVRDAELERCWSGLRPYGGHAVPLIDRVPGASNLIVATGHFRSGLQMSPGTALVVCQMLLKDATAISMEPYSFAILKGGAAEPPRSETG